MLGYWDRYLSSHRYAPDGDGEGGEGEGNGNGGGAGAGAGGNGAGAKPPWASEFGDTFDPDKAWNLINTLRTSERTLKRETSELGKKVKTFEDQDKTEQEKLTSELEQLRTRVSEFEQRERQAGLRTQVSEEARKVGAIYPDDLYRLLDESELKVDDSGKVTNLPKVIADLKTARPALFNSQNINQHNGRETSSPPASNDFNAIIRRTAGRA